MCRYTLLIIGLYKDAIKDYKDMTNILVKNKTFFSGIHHFAQSHNKHRHPQSNNETNTSERYLYYPSGDHVAKKAF